MSPGARREIRAASVAGGILVSPIAIESSFLPPPLHADSADRLLIATARSLGVPILTRDHRILAYAQAGFVGAIVC